MSKHSSNNNGREKIIAGATALATIGTSSLMLPQVWAEDVNKERSEIIAAIKDDIDYIRENGDPTEKHRIAQLVPEAQEFVNQEIVNDATKKHPIVEKNDEITKLIEDEINRLKENGAPADENWLEDLRPKIQEIVEQFIADASASEASESDDTAAAVAAPGQKDSGARVDNAKVQAPAQSSDEQARSSSANTGVQSTQLVVTLGTLALIVVGASVALFRRQQD